MERQSAALFLAPEIHLKEMLYVANSSLHLLTLLFLHSETVLKAYGHFNNNISTLQLVIPLGYGIIDAIGLLFNCTPLLLGFCEGV